MIDLQTKFIKLKKKNERGDLIKYFPFGIFDNAIFSTVLSKTMLAVKGQSIVPL
jgi:hypothetical protein